jgi:hypothetical protein
VNPEPRRKRLHPAAKALAAIAGLAAVGFLFVRSATTTRSEPYAIASAHLAGWTLAADAAQAAEDAAIALRPPAELPRNLFGQLFRRQMESLATPLAPGIVLARNSELARGVTPDQLLALAHEVGLERATLTPRCVGYRRQSARGVARQLYFLWFSLPEYDAFRQRLTSLGNTIYQPAGLSAVMLTAAEPGFEGWQPIVVDEARDCVAPIAIGEAP